MAPEDEARALLHEAGLESLEQPPVDVERLAIDHLDLDVQDHADLRGVPGAPLLPRDVSLSGLLLPAKRRIWVNATEAQRSAGRRAFTIAHEIGHWRMHRDLSDDDAYARFCRSQDVGATARALKQTALLEREANRFAAALLMPEALVRREVRDRGLNVVALARSFGVSGQAMQIRLETLRLLPDYLL
jgi:hypothetical protein